MTIKRFHFGSLFLCLCAGLALAPQHALFSEIVVPRPRESLKFATLVAVGSITPGSGDQPPQFTPTRVLKGTILPGRAYSLRAGWAELQASIAAVVKQAGSQPILFLGSELPNNSVSPDYGDGSVWPSPRYLSSDMLTPDNLEDCIKFAESVLGIPQKVNPAPPGGATAKEPPAKPSEPPPPAAALPQAVKKPVENKPVPHHEPAASTPRIVLVVLAVAALGMLWRRLKRRS